MKTHRFMLPIALLSLAPVAFAQSGPQSGETPNAPSAARKSFDTMKSLAGTWQGPATVDPPDTQMSGDNAPVQVSMRITSRGNALVHEMQEAGKPPSDPTKSDHPVTMFYMDAGHLTLVHYCDAGNRPRMVARSSADGKTVEFDFVDLSGGNENGHMYHALFTIIDANHHTEDWTYLMPGDKPMHAHLNLQRTQ
jgi:hypothetical protein